MFQKYKKYIYLIGWIFLIMLIGSAIGAITNNSVNNWYVKLNRSSLTPPSYVFGIVWSILYALIGISGWYIWSRENNKELGLIKIIYIAQLLLNWSWTPLFFGYQMIGAAFICLVIIVVLVVTLIIKAYQHVLVVSVLLSPYLLWLLLATYLNFYILLYN